MDGRAASQTITDKIPYLLKAGFELTVVSAKTGAKDSTVKHYQLWPWGHMWQYLTNRAGSPMWVGQIKSGVLT